MIILFFQGNVKSKKHYFIDLDKINLKYQFERKENLQEFHLISFSINIFAFVDI